MSNNDSLDILETLLKVFSLALKNMTEKNLYFSRTGIEQKALIDKFGKIRRKIATEKLTFETNNLYKFFLKKIYNLLPMDREMNFNSYYSILNFKRIIYYLQKLIENNINIVEDNIVKLFFYFLFYSNNFEKNKIDLDEAFFIGTFFELKNKYSEKVPYEEPKEIQDCIKNCKLKMEKDLIILINYTFTEIREILDENADFSDKTMNDMMFEVEEILRLVMKNNNENISYDLIEKVKKFYKKKEHLIFTNYFSENQDNKITNKIDSEFLNKIKEQFLSLNFNYNLSNNEKLMKKINNYLEYKNKYYKRMYLSSLYEIFNWSLNDEVVIFSFLEASIKTRFFVEFERAENFINKLKNLNNNSISKMIKKILDKNDFYEIYFSILKSKIVETFYTKNLYLDENDKEFQFKIQNSNVFSDIYYQFLTDYNKKNENFKTFKDLIILKILPKGERAFTIRDLKKIVINPAQFFIGKKIHEENKNTIKKILKGFLMVILLHETEHLLLNEKKIDLTPKKKEGRSLFIKYLFDVYSINHINEEQVNLILNIENWSDHKKIKNIFREQIEDYEEYNISEFILNHFSNSIAFFKTTLAKQSIIKKPINIKK